MVITTDRSQFHAMIRNNLDFIGHLHRLRFLLWRILLLFTRGRSNSGRCGEGAAITWETPRRAAPGKWCAETWFWWSWVRTSGSRWFGSTAAECWPSASTAGRTSLRTGRDTDGQTNKRINATYIGGFKWGQEDHGPPTPELGPQQVRGEAIWCLQNARKHFNGSQTLLGSLQHSTRPPRWWGWGCLFLPNHPTPLWAFLSFFRTDFTDSPDCLPILLSTSVFYFLVFLFSTF